MTWGLKPPMSIGKYSPDGDYVGWEEALGGLSSYDASVKFFRDLGALNDFEKPKQFRCARSYKDLGDIIFLNDGLPAVSERAKRVIETLEPQTHDFWAISVTMPNKSELKFFGVQVGQFQNLFRPKKSASSAYRRSKDFYFIAYASDYPKIVMGDPKPLNCHLWREKKIPDRAIYLSDDLREAMSEAGLQLPKHYQMKV